ncbi:MAG TPA: hypothetical protein ENN55_00190, partial [Firmicutes bacterium]|nr:hypothetical protein [Bacillota bacterium]
VDINAVFGAHSSDAVSLSGGDFVVYVNSPDIWNLTLNKTGYTQTTAAVSVSSYDTDAGDLFMAKNMNTLSGSVVNESAQAINSARVRVSENGNPSNYHDVYTNESGSYTILLPDGDWNAAVSKTGFIAPPGAFVSLSGGGSAIRNFTMTSAANEISGSVNYSGFGMDGVLVRAIPESGPVVEAYTDIYGRYSLSVDTGYFVVNALESGYYSDGPKGVTFASGGLLETGVDFEMTQDAAVNDAAVYIFVDDSSVPLEGVYIYMEGSNTFTAGYTASVYTGASGGVTITDMHEGDYNVTASKSGYVLNSSGVQLLSGITVSHSISLSADVSPLGTIGGYVSDGTNPLAAAEVSLYEPAFPDIPLAVTHTASDGLYSFEIPAGDYMLKAVLSGYVSLSGAKYASVASSGSVQVDFIMQQAVPASIFINPYTGKIYNENIGGPYEFKAVLKGTGGEIIESDFEWSAAPASAGTVSASGVFTPTGDYIGKASIKAKASGISSSHDVMVWQRLNSSYGDVSVSDYAGFSLDIPAGSASASNTIDGITMAKYAPSAVKGSSGTKKVAGNIYNLTEGFGFTDNITITMPVPAEYSAGSVTAGVWNSEAQKWESIESVVSGDFISAETDHFSEYAVLAEMDELKLDYARIVPNPFSPKYHAGARLTFAISSTEGSSVETTIQVFNMGNRLIRTLALNELKAAGTEHTVVWDGRNEDGKWAANGRYFVRVQIKDTRGTKQYLFSVAVVK